MGDRAEGAYLPQYSIQPLRSGLSVRAMSASDSCVCRRMFKSRIVERMVFSAEGLTAGLKPQNIELSARELLAGQRTAALNALRGHLAEIGVVAPQGAHHAYDLKRLVADGFDEYGEALVPDCVRVALRPLVGHIDALDEAIAAIDKERAASVKADETAKRLMTIPGVGPVTASAIVATIQDAGVFASGREFAAFLGLTPRQNSTGGKPRL